MELVTLYYNYLGCGSVVHQAILLKKSNKQTFPYEGSQTYPYTLDYALGYDLLEVVI